MTATSLSDRVRLPCGIDMPQVGLGVWRTADGDEVRKAVSWALEAGYRSVDTASLYGNEAGVGEAIRASTVPRDDIFVTTKVWNTEQGYDGTLRAFETSLKKLGLGHIDLYLEHFPVTGKFKDSWRAMERLLDEKLVRAIGVSNFHPHHIDELLASARVKPAVNQVELHPYLSQKPLLEYCRAVDIAVEAWAPIAKGRVLGEDAILDLSRKHGRTPAQVVLRWELQQGIIVIPKSVHRDRIAENAMIFDFALDDADMAAIDALDRNGRIGTDPDLMQY